MDSLSRCYNIDDLIALARKRLPKGLYDYLDRGAEDEVTLRENSASIKRVLIKQRVGRDVSNPDFSTTLFGVKQSMPMGLAVTGLASMISYQGEKSLARAAAAAGVPYMIGTSNFTAAAELKPIMGDLLWRQIYPPKRRDLLDHHVARARDLGIRVIAITLDSPMVGNREYLRRSGWGAAGVTANSLREMLGAPHWLFGTLLPYLMNGGLPEIADMPAGETRWYKGTGSWANTADDFTWDDIKALRRSWSDVLVLKGISTAEDAKLAAACGADGIIVSNHGGRSLDGCVPSFGALPEIVDAVGRNMTVMVDGGFKRGADMLKAIAIGASAVFVGRATIFSLAAGGEPGVARALQIFREEIRRAMAMIGCRTLSELNRDYLQWPSASGGDSTPNSQRSAA
jgi:isopentenyl diphosphate isomerase/L-lactate dehydrogenase-like FMN-dependent dehydrogenase